MSRKLNISRRRTRRSYSEEFKAEAVQMLLDGHSAASVARNLGLTNPKVLYRWKAKILSSSGPAGTEYRQTLTRAGMRQSMSRANDCYDKAFMESCFGKINIRLGRYYCHKCQSKGNQLELWAAVHKLAIYDAAIDLCRALNHEIPWIQRW